MIERLPPAAAARRWPCAILALVVLALAAALWFPLAYLQRQDAALTAGQHRIAELQARIPGREELLAQERELLEDSIDMEPRPAARQHAGGGGGAAPGRSRRAWPRPWAARSPRSRSWSPRRRRHSPGSACGSA